MSANFTFSRGYINNNNATMAGGGIDVVFAVCLCVIVAV